LEWSAKSIQIYQKYLKIVTEFQVTTTYVHGKDEHFAGEYTEYQGIFWDGASYMDANSLSISSSAGFFGFGSM